MKKIKKEGAQHGYWCTWLTQNYIAERSYTKERGVAPQFVGDQGAREARSVINEEAVFGRNGFAAQWGEIRSDLYLMFDDGWDVPYGVHPADRRDAFGSLKLSEERFPFAKGDPAERLKALSDRVKACGWKGLGIWVSAQRCGKNYLEPFSEKDEAYWRERILWSKYAGVSYWKVDWGTSEHDNNFRRSLSETAEKLYPELVVEHAICCPPLNGVEAGVEKSEYGRFKGNRELCSLAEIAVSYSEVFRTYDVLPAHSIASTLDRTAHLLRFAKGYLNVEDEMYLAAALGCQAGIMRSGYGVGVDRWDDSERLQEVEAAILWQRIAPPFAGGEVYASEEILFDDYVYGADEVWYQIANGNRIEQGAPCAVSRNTPFPEVRAGELGQKPFAVCALHPNGAYSVAALPRTVGGKRGYIGGEVVCPIQKKPTCIAVFGMADRFTFVWERGISFGRITARSVLSGETVDISGDVTRTENGFTVDEKTLKKAWNGRDKSALAIILKFE
ncbi:MAG: hypothetical protein K2L87_05420 [Clostridiales bacterium]|nr:hypothetical protein [Clostridiales bacterium]